MDWLNIVGLSWLVGWLIEIDLRGEGNHLGGGGGSGGGCTLLTVFPEAVIA